MKIKVSDLKRFKSNASSLKVNRLLPILSYIKFADGEVTKNSQHSFFTQKINGITEPFLVDEKTLMNFVDNTQSEDIDIKIKDHRVFITDGKIKISAPTEDVSIFPEPDKNVNDKFEISSELMSSIKIASTFIFTDESEPNRSNVFVGEGVVGASNGFVAFVDKADENCPSFLISKRICNSVLSMDKVKMSQTEKFIFFESDTSMFGFIKTEYPFINFSKFLQYDKDSEKKFEVNKHEFIRFNDMAMSSTPAVVVTAKITCDNGLLKMDMNDSAYERHVVSEVGVEGFIEGEFEYQPHHMNQLLRNMPGNDMTFYQSENKLFVTGEGGSTSLIMQVKKY